MCSFKTTWLKIQLDPNRDDLKFKSNLKLVSLRMRIRYQREKQRRGGIWGAHLNPKKKNTQFNSYLIWSVLFDAICGNGLNNLIKISSILH
jgi:hypothetical protein